MRARDVRDQQWSAAMACGLAKDFSSKARAQQGCQALLERAARHSLATMRLVPDLAIVFVSEKTRTKADVIAGALAALLPPSTLVLAASSTGVLGPLIDDELSSQLTAHKGQRHLRPGGLTEVEDGPAVAVGLATLPGVDLAWACVGERPPRGARAAQKAEAAEACCFGRSARHAGAWWLPPDVRPSLTAWQRDVPGSGAQAVPSDWACTSADVGHERPPALLMLSTERDVSVPTSEAAATLSGVQSGGGEPGALHDPSPLTPPRFCTAGGVAISCALRPPGASTALAPTNVMIKLRGTSSLVCVVPEHQGEGAENFEAALRDCLQARPDDAWRGADVPNADVLGSSEGEGPQQAFWWCDSRRGGEPPLRPAGGVVFTCNGRGQRFHEEANAEARGLEAVLPGVLFVGMFAGGEIGPSYWGFNQGVNGHTRRPARPHVLPGFDVHSFSCAVSLFG
eukprot:Transcript_30139.p1 GENE.Transcript_30139~~Transcript_30139.p1  ORF type:complete len:455 (-),score=119.48 Transcript_30139:85-1449(-)